MRPAASIILWLAPALAGARAGADVPQVQVVAGGESRTSPEACYGELVGPGFNEPDPFPGYAGFVGWVSPVRLRSGDWLVGFSAGYWHASAPTPWHYPPDVLASYIKMGMSAHIVAPTGGRAMLIRSTDGGKTWSKPETIVDTPNDDRHPAFLELSNGILLCSFFTYSSDGDKGHHATVIRSFDHGRTWDPHLIRPNSPLISDESDGPMVLCRDGSILMAVDGLPRKGAKFQAAVLHSTDSGASWEPLATIKADHDLYETSVAELPNEDLVLIARPEGDICWSHDHGHTWTPPVAFGMRLFAPSLYVLRDGTLLCLHGSYTPGYHGLRAIFSQDGGHTWIAPAKDHGFLVDHCYGYAKAMPLPDGSFYVVDQPTGGHTADDAWNMSIRGFRLRLHPDHSGLDLLPAPNHHNLN